MGSDRNKQTFLLLLSLVAGLLSQNLLIPAMSSSVEDQKNYYSPDPHIGTPPTISHRSPPHGSRGSHGSTPPYHGTPPSHGSGGSYGGSPPSNCGNPPSGGHHDPTPTPPTSGGSGGGYYSPPTTPVYGGRSPPTPFIGTPPVTVTPPTTPIILPFTPTVPGTSAPSPPFAFDPNSPPFTCNYWRTHPGLIWGVLGWWGNVGRSFGLASVPGIDPTTSLHDALSNTRTDGFGALYREGSAALLNSMVDTRFPFTTKQVRDGFAAAIGSNKAAAAQARVFKLANEGRLKPRA